MNIRDFTGNLAKGFGIGAANVVPGVSGGTIALVTGIYSRLIDTLSSFTSKETWTMLFKGKFRDFWKRIDGTFVLALGVGMVLSILSLAKLVKWSLDTYPAYTWSFFFGLVACSVFIMIKDLEEKHGHIHWKGSFPMFAGLILGFVIINCLGTDESAAAGIEATFIEIFLCGAVSVCAMILPGISGSFILQIMGRYETIMAALDIQAFDFPTVLAFGVGCVVGLLAFARLLKWLLARFERGTMLVLIGFVIGSLPAIWPLNNIADGTQYSKALLLIFAIVGACLVEGLEYFGKKTKSGI